MAKETLEQAIERTREQFTDKDTVAFLGTVDSGKTVISALLFYHLSRSWVPKSKGKWEAVPSSGDEAFNQIIRDIYLL